VRVSSCPKLGGVVTVDHNQIWTIGPFQDFEYRELERQKLLSFKIPNQEITIQPKLLIPGVVMSH
jgi:hypothetical protein